MPKFEFPLDALLTKLLRLSETLDAKADTAAALAVEHSKSPGEAQETLRQERRSASGREFAKVCREAVGRLREKRAAGTKMIPPTLGELRAYAGESCRGWPDEDVVRWFKHFKSVGWVIGKSKPMSDWQAAADNGFSNWREKNPGRVSRLPDRVAPQATVNGDPPGWAEFLKGVPRRYCPYREELPFLRTKFDALAKAK